MKLLDRLIKSILVMSISTLAVLAQNAKVEVAKRWTSIPKGCELVTPARTDDPVDIQALIKEAYCKGSGDMISEYTYVTNSIKREKDKKGKEKLETYTYEVFFPTLKSGTHTKGILVVTSHNGIPVPPAELEKVRARAAERTEKEEEKIARSNPQAPSADSTTVTGMRPLGVYARTAVNHETIGSKHSVRLSVHTFLQNCVLTLLRREQIEGRETLIFTFSPMPQAQLADNEKYLAALTGEIWIDARDRIVTRLVGWPLGVKESSPSPVKPSRDQSPPLAALPSERAPAVYVEMMRLPQQGIWLPRVTRINGADYPSLFDGITSDSNVTYSNYIRFLTAVGDVKVGQPTQP